MNPVILSLFDGPQAQRIRSYSHQTEQQVGKVGTDFRSSLNLDENRGIALTRSSHRWAVRPGSFDSVHVQELFLTDGNPYGIATVKQVPVAYAPEWIVPYRTRLPAER